MDQVIDFSRVRVTHAVIRRMHERRWRTGYEPTGIIIDHSSYTARGFAIMTAEDLETLHAAADAIGVARGYFDPKRDCYLISINKRKAAIRLGAQPATAKGPV